jgi:hypothetical protein
MSQINVNTILPFSGSTVTVNGATVEGGPIRSTKVGDNLQSVDSADSFLIGSNIFNGTSTGFGYLPQVVSIGSLIGQSPWFSVAESVFIGTETANSLNDSSGSVFVGYRAGKFITSSQNNTLIGKEAGLNLTAGTNNTAIGYNALPAAANTSNSITLGNSSITTLRCAVTSITSLSDARDKKDVADLRAGLDFVNKLRPVEFVWDDRNEEGKHDVADFGFLAQDLKETQEDAEMADVLKLVYDENPEKLEASYGKLLPIMVKAIQELSAELKALKAEK